MSKIRKTKFVDRIYFCSKAGKFIYCKWDHSINNVQKWFWTDFNEKSGYISGPLKVPKSWHDLGWLPEGTIERLRHKK